MAYSLVRLTLYGVFSTIENDLRNVIRNQVLPSRPVEEVFPGDVLKNALERQEKDQGLTDDILSYVDFADSSKILHRNREFLDSGTVSILKRLTAGLEHLIPIRNRVMHSRPLQFDDHVATLEFVKLALNLAPKLFAETKDLANRIESDPHYVFRLDTVPLEQYESSILHNLPIPDFDETGFLGRTEDSKNLLDICKSPWPIITIIGEGGVGKTAMALKVGYDLLDDPEIHFDAVIWASSKTTRLGPREIQQIEGAIKDSFGLFESIATSLDADANVPAIDTILEFMNSFRILLILDNLETVLDEHVRSFLSGIRSQSKVLITSRVGLGELEYRFPLTAMTDGDAVQLLRATAHVRRVPELTRTSNKILKTYCRKMKNNPLFIKWFVSAVQSGARAEQSLVSPKLFLNFCLSNVYDYLGEDSRYVTKAMLAVTGDHSLSVLAYLTEFDVERLQASLQRLLATNIVLVITKAKEFGYESTYALGELPRLFLANFHPPSPGELTNFIGKKKELAVTSEIIDADTGGNPYDVNKIAIRRKDDVVVAKNLKTALVLIKSKAFDDAERLIEKSKQLAPDFHEVYRADAWLNFHRENFTRCREAYEIATELAPDHAPLRVWYGGFLMRKMDDAEAALEQFRRAFDLDPDSDVVRIEFSRALAYLYRFEEATEVLTPVVDNPSSSTKQRRIAFDGWLQISARKAKRLCSEGDYIRAFEELEELYRRFNSIPKSYFDRKIWNTFCSVQFISETIKSQLSSSDYASRAEQMWLTMRAACDSRGEMGKDIAISATPRKFKINQESLREGDESVGEVVNRANTYGFLELESGGRLFFHKSNLRFPRNIDYFPEGTRVSCVVGRSEKGFFADEVKTTSIPRIEGVVSTLRAVPGTALVRTDGFGILSVRRDSFVKDGEWEKLKYGDRVSLDVEWRDKGLVVQRSVLKGECERV